MDQSDSLESIKQRIKRARSVVLDLDADLFCDGEDAVSEALWAKTFDHSAFDNFLAAHSGTSFNPVVGHDEAIEVWSRHAIKGALCLHFDYHHDCYITAESLAALSLSKLDKSLGIGNYLGIAYKAGMIDEVIWVAPDCVVSTHPAVAEEALANSSVPISVLAYSDYLKHVAPTIDPGRVVGAVAAMSPDFLPPQAFRHFFDAFGCDTEFRYRALDYAYYHVISKRKYFGWRWHGYDFSAATRHVYHGSSQKNLELIGDSSRRSFTSPSKRFAACFESDLVRNGELTMGLDLLQRDPDTVVITGHQAANLIQECLSGATYTVATPPDLYREPTGCVGLEFTTSQTLQRVDVHSAALNQLANGDAALSVVPVEELMAWPQSLSVEFLQAFEKWMALDEQALRAFPSTPFFMSIYSELFPNEPSVDFSPLIFWERLASRELIPTAKAAGITTPANGYHSLQHCIDVALQAILIAHLENHDKACAFLAALAHDLSDEDHPDSRTAPDSAQLTKTLLKAQWQDYSSDSDGMVIDAILEHSSTKSPRSSLAAILRDADRVRLSWERGYDERFFSTNAGRQFASRGPGFTENVLAKTSFEAGSILEIHAPTSNLFCWYGGARFDLGSARGLTPGDIGWLVAKHYVQRIVCFDGKPPKNFQAAQLSTLVPPCEQLRQSERYAGLASYLLLETASEDHRDDEIMQTGGFNSNEVQVLVTNGSLHRVLAELPSIDNNQDVLVVSANTEDAVATLKQLCSGLLERRTNSLETVGAKIITDLAWCHLEEYELVHRLFAKHPDNYSPLLFDAANSLGSDIIRETFDNEIWLDKECGECIFSLSCTRRDFNGREWLTEKPAFQAAASTWNPYSDA